MKRKTRIANKQHNFISAFCKIKCEPTKLNTHTNKRTDWRALRQTNTDSLNFVVVSSIQYSAKRKILAFSISIGQAKV